MFGPFFLQFVESYASLSRVGFDVSLSWWFDWVWGFEPQVLVESRWTSFQTANQGEADIWAWVKIKPPGKTVPFTRVPFWEPIVDLHSYFYSFRGRKELNGGFDTYPGNPLQKKQIGERITLAS